MDYPELVFQASQLSPERVLSALDDKGCVVIRALFNPLLIQRFRQRAERVFCQRQQEFEQKTLPPGYAKNYHYGRMSYLSLRELDAPGESAFQVFRLFQRSLLLPLLEQFYQRAVWLNQLESNVRYLKGDDVSLYVPFHQDGFFHQNPEYPQLNCWLPLVHCGSGARAPGMEVVPIGLQKFLPFDPDGVSDYAPVYQSFALNAERVINLVGAEHLWHPALWPGDVLLMNAYVLHRSGWHSQVTQDRYSIELRALPADTLSQEIRTRYGLVRVSAPDYPA